MSRCITTFFSIVLLAALTGPGTERLCAQDAECPITVASVSGTVSGKGGSLSSGTMLAKGDTVTTGNDGVLELNLDGAVLKLGPRSTMFVDVSYCPDPSSRAVRVKLLSGSLWAKGGTPAPKVDIATERFVATLGTSTLIINGRYLDTMFTVAKESQAVETRDWKDTVEVLHYTFPHKGHVATIYALAGNVTIVPWGGRGTILKQGNQAVYGYDESFISSRPTPINGSELLFDPAGTYLAR